MLLAAPVPSAFCSMRRHVDHRALPLSHLTAHPPTHPAPLSLNGALSCPLQSYMELMNYLLRQRIVFVQGYINDKVATQIVGQLMALEAMDETEDIRMYINSPGEWVSGSLMGRAAI